MVNDYLKEFLNLYWLRPETAILNALLAKNLPNDYLKNKISADISCGDGIFSFVANGGKIDNKFNYYEVLKVEENIAKKDIYSYYDDSYNPKIIKPSNYQYDYGIDINLTMLQKAKKLNIYKKGLNKSILESEKLNIEVDLVTIFSTIYMFNDIDNLLQNLKFILKDNGVFITNIKTGDFLDFYDNLEIQYPKSFSNYLERDMRKVFPNLLSIQKWEDKFQKNGFEIIEKIPTFSKNLVPVWSIGLRFLTPLLVKMGNSIENKNNLLEIKQQFSETFYEVLNPFYNDEIKEASSYLYVLRKK